MITQTKVPTLRLVMAVGALLVAVLVLFTFAAPASAQTDGGAASIVEQLELQMLALSPLVALVSSVLLKPEAAKGISKAVPAVVGVIGSIVYFLLSSFPDAGEAVVANIVLVVAAGTKWYDPLDGVARVVFGQKLNAVTGSGIVGAGTVIEGD